MRSGDGGGGAGRPANDLIKEAFRQAWPEVKSLVPLRVREEVERYLQCGRPRYGFVDVECSDCASRELVALRCRGRVLSVCTTRRALETALQLEEQLPRVAHASGRSVCRWRCASRW